MLCKKATFITMPDVEKRGGMSIKLSDYDEFSWLESLWPTTLLHHFHTMRLQKTLCKRWTWS